MNHRLLIRVTAPAVAIGLLLFASCLASIRYINRLQANLDILAENVKSLQAAQELEIRVRQMRFHTMLYLLDPEPARLDPIKADQERFEEALTMAHRASTTDEERKYVRAIEAGYRDYQAEQARLRKAAAEGRPAKPRPAKEFPHLSDKHPVAQVVVPCQELLRVNKEKMEQTADECQRVSREGHRW